MQIVIDIPDEEYKRLIYMDMFKLRGYIENGIILPKGHDYIDRNNAITSICQRYTACERMKMLSFTPNLIKQEVADILCAEPTIIEADKEEESEAQDGWSNYVHGLIRTSTQLKEGQWIRMSDLSEQEDDRYKCSHCGNVIHHKNKMNLYTFNSWCGRCGSDNGRKIEVKL